VQKSNNILGGIIFSLLLASTSSAAFAAANNTAKTAPLSTVVNSSKTEIKNNNINTTTVVNNSPSIETPGLKVVASFYPMYEFAKQVGGNRIEVSSLIPIGVEPHDFEPTIQQIQNAQTADMMVINGAGMEGMWIKKIGSKFLVDTGQGIKLLGSNESVAHGGATDPHIWLDPILAKQQVEKIRDAFVKIDPGNAGYYSDNAKKYNAKLDALDASIKAAFSNCSKKDFIAFHNAFSYFAKRYGLNQHSIHEGVTPEGEILPQRLTQVIDLAHKLGLNAVYSEELLDPRSANVIAQEIPNGKVLVLSPIEGINKDEQKTGVGYIDKMNQDIGNLKIGLGCK
jgi:zinc transport system substrate-binding protein